MIKKTIYYSPRFRGLNNFALESESKKFMENDELNVLETGSILLIESCRLYKKFYPDKYDVEIIIMDVHNKVIEKTSLNDKGEYIDTLNIFGFYFNKLKNIEELSVSSSSESSNNI